MLSRGADAAKAKTLLMWMSCCGLDPVKDLSEKENTMKKTYPG